MATTCFLVERVRDSEGNTIHWKRQDNGEVIDVISYYELPAGAMFYATWLEDVPGNCGPDGRSLAVMTPAGVWYIDGTASNCDSPCKHCNIIYKDHEQETNPCKNYEDSRPHKCWVRHGQPPNITVNKDGVTCTAGGGSIMIGNYHGFLTNGELT